MGNKQPLPIGALIPSRRSRGTILFLALLRLDFVCDDAAHEADEVRAHVLELVVVEAVKGRLHGVFEGVFVLGAYDVHLGEQEGGVWGAELEDRGGGIGGGDCGAEVVLFAKEVLADPVVHCRHGEGDLWWLVVDSMSRVRLGVLWC